MMGGDEKLERAIRGFHARVSEIERVVKALNDVLGMQPECALNEAINALIGGYMGMIESCDGVDGWLEWW